MITPSGIKEIVKARDFTDTTGSGADGFSMVWDDAAGKFVLSEITGVSDHGALTGLADDDHTQYHNDARGDARYYKTPFVESLGGGGLIVNGSGFYRNNTNFSAFTFDPLVSNGGPGAFRHEGTHASKQSDATFPVLPGNVYRLSVDVTVTSNNTKGQYVGLAFQDADGKTINAINHMFHNGTLAQLTRPFTLGTDTAIYFDDNTGWSFGAADYERGFIFWNYVDSFGLAYPPNSYSRNYARGLTPASATVTDEGGGEYSVVTATSGYIVGDQGATATIPAGTYISRSNSGGAYKYITMSNVVVPTDGNWHSYAGYIGGLDRTGTNKPNMIPPGAQTAKLLLLPNFTGASASDVKVWFANLDFRVATEVNLVEDGSVATSGALGTISYTRGFRPTATVGSVASTVVIG